MGDIFVYVEPIDDYIVTVASNSTEIAIEVVEEHEVRVEAFEYPAEITVLIAKISEVEEVATEANSAATTALAAATTAQSSADAAMAQAEAATDMAATNTLSISSILSNFSAWVLNSYLGALTLLDAAIAAGDSIQALAGKLQGQLNAVKVRLGLLENNVIFSDKLVRDITSSEYVITGLSIPQNTPFRIIIFCPANGLTQGVFLLRFNNDSRALYQRALSITTGFALVVGYTYTRASFECVLCDGDVWGRDWIAYNNGGSYNRTGEVNATNGAAWTSITSISILRNNMAKIPAGSVIRVIRG